MMTKPNNYNPILRLFFGRFMFPSLVIAFGLVVAASIQLSAFEAHVLNVTAVIDRESSQCIGGQPKFCQHTAGCDGGKGENIWASQVNVLSNNFSGFFANISGNGICLLFDSHSSQPCPPADTVAGARCYAEAHALANELNLVSGRLDPQALLAGAIMGSEAFAHLGLDANSTIEEAMIEVEEILAFPGSTATELFAAAVVGKATHLFYEDHNPQTPQCIFEAGDWLEGEIISFEEDVLEEDTSTEESIETVEVAAEGEENVIEEVIEEAAGSESDLETETETEVVTTEPAEEATEETVETESTEELEVPTEEAEEETVEVEEPEVESEPETEEVVVEDPEV
ncbi:MAG: hypothetical protein AAB589_01065 [Patescibacteria group bacterium]